MYFADPCHPERKCVMNDKTLSTFDIPTGRRQKGFERRPDCNTRFLAIITAKHPNRHTILFAAITLSHKTFAHARSRKSQTRGLLVEHWRSCGAFYLDS